MPLKGKDFERETAALAGLCSICGGSGRLKNGFCKNCRGKGKYGKRIPMSGSVGTMAGEPRLAGDARWDFPWLTKPIVLECKHGYAAKNKQAKSMVLQREWFDKHLDISKNLELYPAFAMKFKFTKEDGVSKFILIPFPTMEKILKEMENIYLEVQEYREQTKRGVKRP